MQDVPEKSSRENPRNPLAVKEERLTHLLEISRDPELQRVTRVYLLLLRGHGAGSPEMRMLGVETEHDLAAAVEEVARQLESGQDANAGGEGENGRKA